MTGGIQFSELLDYLAAPFGSDEWWFLNYGIEGVDYQMTNGVPVSTDKGASERGDLVYVMAGLPVFFYPQKHLSHQEPVANPLFLPSRDHV